MANVYTGSVGAGLRIREVDSNPDVFGVTEIIVSNGTLIDDGAGTVTITTGGGGGGGVTALSLGTTGLTPSVSSTGSITVAGTLVLVNGGTGATTASGARTNLGLGTAAVEDTTFFATAAQGLLADSATQPGDNVSTLTNDAGYSTSAGTVTSIIAGTGLSGGTITATGTVALANTAVVAGSYTSADITVDAQGRLTSAASGSGGVTLSGSTNNTIATVTGANALIGEANLTFTGSLLTLTGALAQSGGNVGFFGGGASQQPNATVPGPPDANANQAMCLQIIGALQAYGLMAI